MAINIVMAGLLITRDVAVRAIYTVDPKTPILGISKLMLINFPVIRWVDYIPPERLWELDFYTIEDRFIWHLTYA